MKIVLMLNLTNGVEAIKNVYKYSEISVTEKVNKLNIWMQLLKESSEEKFNDKAKVSLKNETNIHWNFFYHFFPWKKGRISGESYFSTPHFENF